jgi:hypothetical protein
MSATSKSKLMPFIYFTAKTSQELARLGALLLELCDTRLQHRRQRDKLPGSLSILSKLVAHETGTSAAQHMSGSTDVMQDLWFVQQCFRSNLEGFHQQQSCFDQLHRG